MATGVTTDESKSMCVAHGTRSPSMRARTPTKLDSFARCRAPHHGPQSRRRSSFSEHEKRRAPSLPSFEAVSAFSARARPFSLRLVSPRGALPLPSRFPLGALQALRSKKSRRLFRLARFQRMDRHVWRSLGRRRTVSLRHAYPCGRLHSIQRCCHPSRLTEYNGPRKGPSRDTL